MCYYRSITRSQAWARIAIEWMLCKKRPPIVNAELLNYLAKKELKLSAGIYLRELIKGLTPRHCFMLTHHFERITGHKMELI